MAIPNLINEVESARQRWPQDWRDAHTGNANTEGFIRKLAFYLNQRVDPRVGLNGKRGNPNDISDDALAFYDESGSAIDKATGKRMEILDVIGSAGTSAATPSWNPVGPGFDPSGSPNPGAWVSPPVVDIGSGGVVTPPPVIVPPPTPAQCKFEPPDFGPLLERLQSITHILGALDARLRNVEAVCAGLTSDHESLGADLDGVLDFLRAIDAKLEDIAASTFPTYEGKVFGAKIILRPQNG